MSNNEKAFKVVSTILILFMLFCFGLIIYDWDCFIKGGEFCN